MKKLIFLLFFFLYINKVYSQDSAYCRLKTEHIFVDTSKAYLLVSNNRNHSKVRLVKGYVITCRMTTNTIPESVHTHYHFLGENLKKLDKLVWASNNINWKNKK